MTPPSSLIRVLLADDHPLVRAGIRASLERHARIRIVGEAPDGAEAVRLACALKPDIVLLDINMPGLGGFAAAKLLRKKLPSCRPIFLTMHEDSEYARQAVAAGAKGFVQKDASPEELRRAIEAVHRGRTYFSDAASRALLADVVGAGGSLRETEDDGLTARERTVLVQITEGVSNKTIAARLGIGVRTVETHRQRLMMKLDIRTPAGLTKYALAHGLIKLE